MVSTVNFWPGPLNGCGVGSSPSSRIGGTTNAALATTAGWGNGALGNTGPETFITCRLVSFHFAADFGDGGVSEYFSCGRLADKGLEPAFRGLSMLFEAAGRRLEAPALALFAADARAFLLFIQQLRSTATRSNGEGNFTVGLCSVQSGIYPQTEPFCGIPAQLVGSRVKTQPDLRKFTEMAVNWPI